MKDEYQTILTSSEGLFRDRGSKFIATAHPMTKLEQLDEFLLQSKKAHPKSRHHCYAYRLSPDGTQYRANDDGEPSGTAGRPILGQIDSFGLTNVLIVVIRYFGGTKLGTSGLINAYKTAAREALEQAAIVQQTVKAYYRIEFEYGKMSQVMSAIKASSFEIIAQHFETEAYIDIAIKANDRSPALHNLGAAIAELIPEVYEPEKDQAGFTIIEKGIY